MNCRVRVTKEILDLFPQYRPRTGDVYDARYIPAKHQKDGSCNAHRAFCVVDVLDKRIVLREDEFEIVM